MIDSRDDMVTELLLPEMQQMLADGRTREVREALEELLDPEVADLLRGLAPPQRAAAFRLLSGERAADVFDFLEQDDQEALIDELSDEQVAAVFNEMDTDDRVDFLEDAPSDLARSTLDLLEPEARAETERSLEWPAESVGRLMTPRYITVRPAWTVEQTLEQLRDSGRHAETLHTLYLIDDAGNLIDHIRLRELVLAAPDQTCEHLREGSVVSLNAQDDRETAVRMMQRYDLPVLPVVDQDNVLVGIVTFDDVADVAAEETTEDIHKLGGMEALGRSYFSASLADLIRKRGLWLMVLFFGGLLTVTAMGFFHKQLQETAILALFVPLIIASGGNSGTQAATLMVRSLAVGELRPADWWRILGRELASGLVLGSILGVIGLVVATLVAWWLPAAGAGALSAALHVGFAIGTAIVGVVITGVVTGAMLPLGLEWIGVDPAACSTPFVATVVDFAGLVIYFLVAMIVLGI